VNKLLAQSDRLVLKLNKRGLEEIIGKNGYHSPEESETDHENLDENKVVVHDLSWRSDTVSIKFIPFNELVI